MPRALRTVRYVWESNCGRHLTQCGRTPLAIDSQFRPPITCTSHSKTAKGRPGLTWHRIAGVAMLQFRKIRFSADTSAARKSVEQAYESGSGGVDNTGPWVESGAG